MADDDIIVNFRMRASKFEHDEAELQKLVDAVVKTLADSGEVEARKLVESIIRQLREGVRTVYDENNEVITRTGTSNRRTGAVARRMISGESADDISPDAKEMVKALNFGANVVNQGITGLTSVTKMSFGLVQDIYDKLKSASPLLQGIEQLFNLAMTLFFMPIGNKLGEVILPAVLELVDNAVEAMEALEGKSLSEIVDYAITEGVRMLADFFHDIGDILIEEGEDVARIGTFLNALGDFIENDAAGLLITLVNLATWTLEHIKEIIAVLVGLYTMMYTMQLLSMYVSAAGEIPLIGAGLAMGIAATAGVITGGTVYGAMSANSPDYNARGGYVPASEGGSLHVIGEGGEGEYIIPESKANSFGGGQTNNFYIYGVTSEELTRLIDERINDQISGARIRGAF